MNDEMSFLEDEKVAGSMENDVDGVFIRDRSSFYHYRLLETNC